jgi:hypothetical protein
MEKGGGYRSTGPTEITFNLCFCFFMTILAYRAFNFVLLYLSCFGGSPGTTTSTDDSSPDMKTIDFKPKNLIRFHFKSRFEGSIKHTMGPQSK